MKRKIAMGMLLVVAVMQVGCSNQDKSTQQKADSGTVTVQEKSDRNEESNPVVLTVNNETVSYRQACLYLQSRKEEIEDVYGKEIWNMKIDDKGTTYEQQFKEKVLEQLIYLKLVCSKAEELSIKLTEDEMLNVNEYTADFMSKLSEDAVSFYSVSEENVKQIYKDNVLANKVFESVTLNVDTEVSDEEAKEIDLAYIFVSKHNYDDDGQKIQYSADNMEILRQRADNLLEQAQMTEDFSKLAKDFSDDEEYLLTAGRGDMAETLENTVFSLRTGQISPVLETSEGFFIFYCRNELNREATDARKEEIIKSRQEEAFKNQYAAWYEDKEVKVEEKLWEKISVKEEVVN